MTSRIRIPRTDMKRVVIRIFRSSFQIVRGCFTVFFDCSFGRAVVADLVAIYLVSFL